MYYSVDTFSFEHNDAACFVYSMYYIIQDCRQMSQNTLDTFEKVFNKHASKDFCYNAVFALQLHYSEHIAKHLIQFEKSFMKHAQKEVCLQCKIFIFSV